MYSDGLLFLITQHIINLLAVGPCTALVVRTSLISRTNGVKTVFGAIFGTFLMRVLLVFGLAFTLSQYPFLFSCFKIVGAAYLVLFGLTYFFSAYKAFLTPKNADICNDTVVSKRSNFLEGFLMSIANPLGSIPFIALFSTVITPETSLFLQLSYLVILSSISLAFYLCMALFLSTNFIKNGMTKAEYILDVILGSTFVYWGIKIFTETI